MANLSQPASPALKPFPILESEPQVQTTSSEDDEGNCDAINQTPTEPLEAAAPNEMADGSDTDEVEPQPLSPPTP